MLPGAAFPFRFPRCFLPSQPVAQALPCLPSSAAHMATAVVLALTQITILPLRAPLIAGVVDSICSDWCKSTMTTTAFKRPCMHGTPGCSRGSLCRLPTSRGAMIRAHASGPETQNLPTLATVHHQVSGVPCSVKNVLEHLALAIKAQGEKINELKSQVGERPLAWKRCCSNVPQA